MTGQIRRPGSEVRGGRSTVLCRRRTSGRGDLAVNRFSRAYNGEFGREPGASLRMFALAAYR